jgi:putative phosphoribosyl transferase
MAQPAARMPASAANARGEMIYKDRRDAGKRLACSLEQFAGRADVVVLALPRGGVPVGFEVAEALGAPLDVFIVRKLGVPGHEEYAMGAVASGGVIVLNEEATRSLRIPASMIEGVAAREQKEIVRRDRLYRGDRPPLDVRDKTIIIVDDGLATGSTMRAAVAALRNRSPKRIIVAVPVGAESSCDQLREVADEVICPSMPEPFEAVGLWFENFEQTSDAEVHELLDRSVSRRPINVLSP